MHLSGFSFETFFDLLFMGELVVFMPWLFIVTRPMRVKDVWLTKRATLRQRHLVATGEGDTYEKFFVFDIDGVRHACKSRNSTVGGASIIGQSVMIYVDPRDLRSCYEEVPVDQLLKAALFAQSSILLIGLIGGFHTAWKSSHGGTE